MSGSPVFVDGRLVGAVAYAFPFGKEPIAGITPIGEMIDATRTPRPARRIDALPRREPGAACAAPLDRAVGRGSAATAAALDPLRPPPGGALPPALAGATLSPLALPLVFSGFEPDTFDWARGIFVALGFAPVLGGGRDGARPRARCLRSRRAPPSVSR